MFAKQKAHESGAFEAWFVDENGFVTEGSSTNAWILTSDGILVTRPAEHGILRGITRGVVIEAAEAEGIAVEERPFSLSEALAAKEAFITASSTIVLPIVTVDGHRIGDGKAGPIATRLRELYHRHAQYGPCRATAVA